MEPRDVVIEGRGLAIGYRNGKSVHPVHAGLCFELRRGELTCLLGANGAGKSTLLRTLAAAQPALEGQLRLLGKPVAEYGEKERSRTIGVVLTDKTQAGGLTVFELAALGRQPHTGFFGRLTAEDKAIVRRALEAVGIGEKAGRYVAELSDGERQKVMIAKALVQECPVILLDEPTAFLDVVSRIELMNLLHRLADHEGKAILLSTHDVEQALVLADRLWLLTPEHGLECGVTEDLILAGRMDTLFPRRDSIRFDLMHGVYSPTVEGRYRICLKADDEVLRHWVQNALNRRGCLCLPPEAFQPQVPVVEALSSKRFNLTAGGQYVQCTSVEDLLERLFSLLS